jgi:histidinol-phosphate/aromatic aminotransferase/cobyric acid decarboxylase-like protein/adenosyl cobinamide kinase/adenosyl cobinamide phosphate guanylyltransferase
VLILVLGGVRSGKSAFAERLAGASPEVIYLATYQPPPGGDAEMAGRVDRHSRRRPPGWRTVEAADPLAAFGPALAGAGRATLLVDGLTGWLAAALEPPGGGDAALRGVAAFAAAAARRAAPTIVVADETGLGGVAGHPVARRFADVAGDACQLLAAAATAVWLVVAGQPLALKGGPAGLAPAAGNRPGSAAAGQPLALKGGPAGLAPAAGDRSGLAAAEAGRLRFHGDTEAGPGDLDLAVSVVAGGPPPAVASRIASALGRLDRYPDDRPATRALAARHGRPPGEVLPLNGAAEGFWLLAGLARGPAVCVHPSFTEPEAALRARGVPVERVFRDPDCFALRPDAVGPDAGMVVLGNPNNPTGTLEPAHAIAGLARDGRLLVVDEAFMDFVAGQAESLAGRRDLPGLVVVRSLTKVWGLPGLRAGYLLAPAPVVSALQAGRQPWAVSAPALAALEAYGGGDPPSGPPGVPVAEDLRAETDAIARRVATARDALAAALGGLPGVRVWASAANFLLLRVPGGPAVRERLRAGGIAVRRGETFPGLTPDHLRVAVGDPEANARLVEALRRALGGAPP